LVVYEGFAAPFLQDSKPPLTLLIRLIEGPKWPSRRKLRKDSTVEAHPE
jgi:hypothetical protein